jgi:hypothetical protein
MLSRLRSLLPWRRRDQNAWHRPARVTSHAPPSLEPLEDRCLPQATPGTVLTSSQDTTFLTQAAQNDLQAGSLGALAFSQSTNSQVQFLGGLAFMQSVQDLARLLPLLQADGVAFPILTSQQVFLATSLTSLNGLAFDQQLLTAVAQSNILALQQTQTEINSGTNIQLRALASARLAELQQLQLLTLPLEQTVFSSTFVGSQGSFTNTVVRTNAINGFGSFGSSNGFATINNLGFPIGTSNNGFNTINNLGFNFGTSTVGIGGSAALGFGASSVAFV